MAKNWTVAAEGGLLLAIAFSGCATYFLAVANPIAAGICWGTAAGGAGLALLAYTTRRRKKTHPPLDLSGLCSTLLEADLANLKVAIIDTGGMELVGITREQFSGEKDSLPTMINQMMHFFEQFLGFLEPDPYHPFTFSWYFDEMVILAAGSPHGSILLYCAKGVNDRRVKKLLKESIISFENLVEQGF